MKKLFLFLVFVNLNSLAQDCPNRIGDFIVNSTTYDDLQRILPSYVMSTLLTIDNARYYEISRVSQDELDDEYSGGISAYEVKPDMSVIKSWYNVEVASPNDSTKVIFIPNYKTDDLSIKNVLLKFYDEKLYFIRASLSKDYTNIIIEKYKGKGHESNVKKSANSCKNPKFKKYLNKSSQFYFTSEEDRIRAILTFDFKINKFCETVINDKIEIFDFDIYLREGNKIIPNLDSLENTEKERLRVEKEQKLKRF